MTEHSDTTIQSDTALEQDFSRGFWATLKQAISGNDLDFTKVNLRKAIFLLAVPMVMEMIMESVFAVVDIFFVSKLGSNAVASVGITESLMTLLYAVAMGLAVSTTAMVSRRIGEKEPAKAARVAFQAILSSFVLSVLIAIPGAIYAKELLQLMGAEADLIRETWTYPAIMFGGNLVIMWLFIINAVFRGAGDAAISMRILIISNLLNIILDPILIFGWGPIPAMGITGAAIATNIGRGIAVVYQLYILFRGSSRIRIAWEGIKFRWDIIRQLVKLSLGGIGQSIIATSSWIGMVRIISEFGSDVLAGYTIGIRIIIFSILPSWGLSNAAATLVGQNLGANKPERAEKAVWVTGKANMIFLGIVGLIFFNFPAFFIGLFTDIPEVITSGAKCLKVVSLGFLAYGLAMVLVQSLNGAGDTLTPTYINLICFWLVEIPVAYLLAHPFGMKETGVFTAIVVGETLMTIIAFIVFKRGKWKLQKL